MPWLCELYPGIRLTTEEKIKKNLSQGRKTSVRVEKPVRVGKICQGMKTSVRLRKTSVRVGKTSVSVGKPQSGQEKP